MECNTDRVMTAIPGCSCMFEYEGVTYATAGKQTTFGLEAETLETHGAVRELTVREMALGAQSLVRVDFAMAVSGIAGPDGGTAEKPVGLVWIAVAGKTGVVAHQFLFGHDRAINIERSSMAALFMLWRLLHAENRSEERRVGKECVSTCRSRWSPYP